MLKRLMLGGTILLMAMMAINVFAMPPGFPPGRIMFHTAPNDNWDLYMNEVGTGGYERRTIDSDRDLTPSFSPDGVNVVFVSTRDGAASLYTMHYSGGSAQRITTPSSGSSDSSPDWASDGFIYFTRVDPSAAGIYKVKPDGTGLTKVVGDSKASAPSVSPDGQSLAYHYQTSLGRKDIVIKGLTTSNLITVTSAFTSSYNVEPSWDGNNALLFQVGNGASTSSIWRTELGTDLFQQLVGGGVSSPAAGPDGWFAYSNFNHIIVKNKITGEGWNITPWPVPFTDSPDWWWENTTLPPTPTPTPVPTSTPISQEQHNILIPTLQK